MCGGAGGGEVVEGVGVSGKGVAGVVMVVVVVVCGRVGCRGRGVGMETGCGETQSDSYS